MLRLDNDLLRWERPRGAGLLGGESSNLHYKIVVQAILAVHQGDSKCPNLRFYLFEEQNSSGTVCIIVSMTIASWIWV